MFTSSLISRLYSYCYPKLIHADRSELEKHRNFLNKITNTSTAILCGSAGYLFWQTPKVIDRKGLPSWDDAKGSILSTLIAMTSLKILMETSKQADRIQHLLDADILRFDELYQYDILERFRLGDLQQKFKTMIDKKLDHPDRKKDEFLSLSQEFDLLGLTQAEIATIRDCQFETHGIDLKEIRHSELKDLFPLRLSLSKGLQLTGELKKESERQENLYQKLMEISKTCSCRGLGGGGSQRDMEFHPGEQVNIDQREWEKQIGHLLR